MAISIFDLYKIGIGPSSSHTVGPMNAANLFAQYLRRSKLINNVSRVRVEMFGSLGATGKGHGTPGAILLGLELETPEAIDITTMAQRVSNILTTHNIYLAQQKNIEFRQKTDLILHSKKSLPYHPNGMVFTGFDTTGHPLTERTYYSVGGGFIASPDAQANIQITEDDRNLPYPFTTGAELQALCDKHNLSIADIMWKNELSLARKREIRSQLKKIWICMQECVENGTQNQGILPGGLKVRRRASELEKQLLDKPEAALSDPLTILDWVTLYALAVNEENAAGGRVVTAPTNGAAGIIPAVLHYYHRFVPQANEEGIFKFLLTSAAIGILFKTNASISGAEVGCQGEVGSACSMAAAGLTEVMGGTPSQVQNAAEIGMEHNLGLTCDPIGGLVQIPCIERNAMAAIKAISASRMALRGDGAHFVSLDKVIKTMRDTGRDMQDKYKETSRGGLAINVIPVNIIEC